MFPVPQALRSFFSKGDYSFNSPTHHGTPDERLHAVQAGLKDAQASQFGRCLPMLIGTLPATSF